MGSDSETYFFLSLLCYVFRLGDLMIQLVLIILTKRKEMICYCESFGYGGTTLSNIVTNDLTHVGVPTENGSNILTMDFLLTSPYNGLFKSSP
jgi:hypothetical protein